MPWSFFALHPVCKVGSGNLFLSAERVHHLCDESLHYKSGDASLS